MRFHNFWCILFVLSKFLKHVQKTPKSWEKVCSITIFHQNPEKNTFTGLKNPQNWLFFSSHLFFRQSWTKAFGHFCVSGAFSNSHRSNPTLTPQTVLHVCTQNKCGMRSSYIFVYFLQSSISIGDNSSVFSPGAGLV